MKRSTKISKRREELKEKETLRSSQEEELRSEERKEKTVDGGRMDELQRELSKSYRSTWAQNMEQELINAAKEAEKSRQ